eukprot:1350047-Pleurochrysis_carterae.AAC.2
MAQQQESARVRDRWENEQVQKMRLDETDPRCKWVLKHRGTTKAFAYASSLRREAVGAYRYESSGDACRPPDNISTANISMGSC